MTQSQLNSMAKRVNTALVQYAKTFGMNSDAYKNYEAKIFNVFGASGTHVTKSGHLAINLGKNLLIKEEGLKELDRPYNKVKGQMKAAESLIKNEMKQQNPSLDVTKIKIPKAQILAKVEDISKIQNFFDNEIVDMYTLRQENPQIDKLLKQLEGSRGKGNKITYNELNNIIDELEEIYNKYKEKNIQQIVNDEDIESRTSKGTKL